jgi:RNA polymerase primary sigma factor
MKKYEDSDFGDFCRMFEGVEVLTPAEEKRLLLRIKKGDQEAKEHFIKANIRLVISRVLRFCSPNDPRTMTLISDGIRGLFTAIDRFKVELGFKFSTYAVCWIESGIRKGLKFFEKETVASLTNMAHAYKTGKRDLTEMLGRSPTDREVAEYLGWSSYKTRVFQKYKEDRAMIAHNLSGEIPADTQESPISQSVGKEVRESIGRVLKRLTTLEEDVIRRRYGIGCQEQTLADISLVYKKSRERIRQIESTALRKLFILLKESDIPPEMRANPPEKPGGPQDEEE